MLVRTLIVSLLWATTALAVPRPEAIDPTLFDVETAAEFRVLIFSVCSKEHCWTRQYLQVLDLGSFPRSIECSAEITELQMGHVVQDASWIWREDDGARNPMLELDAVASHGAFEPYTARVVPQPDCSYSIDPSAPPAEGTVQPPNGRPPGAARLRGG